LKGAVLSFSASVYQNQNVWSIILCYFKRTNYSLL